MVFLLIPLPITVQCTVGVSEITVVPCLSQSSMALLTIVTKLSSGTGCDKGEKNSHEGSMYHNIIVFYQFQLRKPG